MPLARLAIAALLFGSALESNGWIGRSAGGAGERQRASEQEPGERKARERHG